VAVSLPSSELELLSWDTAAGVAVDEVALFSFLPEEVDPPLDSFNDLAAVNNLCNRCALTFSR
jgi:hypothetical protein